MVIDLGSDQQNADTDALQAKVDEYAAVDKSAYTPSTVAVFEEAFSIKDVPVTAVGPVIGTHAGPGAKVIAYFTK